MCGDKIEIKTQSQEHTDSIAITLLRLLLGFFLFEMKEHERENTDARHHAEGRSVVRVGRADESFVLIVAQRNNGDLIITINFD